MAIEVDIAQVRRNMSDIANFAGFVNERVEMERRKHETPYEPGMVWSEDPYLADKHFANVDRTLDASTNWYVWNYYAPNADNQNLWMAPIIARYFNKPATINQIPLPLLYNDEELERYFLPRIAWIGHVIRDTAYSPFNHQAYMRYANSSTQGQFQNLIRAMIVNRHRFGTMITQAATGEAVMAILSLLPGIGTYIAAEILQDYHLTPVGRNYIDKDTFIMVSSAAKSGLNLLFERDLGMAVPEPIKRKEVEVVRQKLQEKLDMAFTLWEVTRALGLYFQYYTLLIGSGDSIRDYVPGRAIRLEVPDTPESWLS